jgi:hypothetical protein
MNESIRKCRKCQSIIPNRLNINGKQHNLKNRKFCLDCSPFKKHNTSKYDPIERRPKTSEKAKTAVKVCLYRRAYSRKINLIKSKGGKCESCGYSSCLRALQFHHSDPSTKLFGLSLNNLWSKNLESIHLEAEKCILLCANCHFELEDKLSNENASEELKKAKGSFGLL